MLTLLTNITNNATTQLTGYDFNSYCRFGDKFLACKPTALCAIGGSSGTAPVVSSLIKTFITKLGYDGNKRLRFIYLGVETQGSLKITPYVDGVAKTAITFTPTRTGRQFAKVPVNRTNGGAYIELEIENVAGCWFAIDQVSVLPINLALGRS